MSDFVIDTAELRRAAQALQTVQLEFAGANARSDEVAGAVTHPGLAERIRGFAHNWDDRRVELEQQIKDLAVAAAAIADAFEGLEAEFVDMLRGDSLRGGADDPADRLASAGRCRPGPGRRRRCGAGRRPLRPRCCGDRGGRGEPAADRRRHRHPQRGRPGVRS